MPTPIAFEDVAPVVPVRDLQAAMERYRQLGFDVRAYGHGTGYGYAQSGSGLNSPERVGGARPQAYRGSRLPLRFGC